MVKDEIQKLVKESLAALHFDVEEISLEHPENPEHGDYSTNVALVLAKQLKKSPHELAQLIASTINYKLQTRNCVEKVEVASPGFINFFLSHDTLVEELKRIAKEKKEFGRNNSLKQKNIMVEFTDPNPFKEFHIGHLYSNIVGESLCRLFEAAGAVIKRANYQGDVGMHVAKAILGMKLLSHTMPKESDSLYKKVRWLGMCYAAGALEEGRGKKGELEKINKAVYEQNDDEINKLYKKGRKWSLQKFAEIYKRLGTKFDYYYFERDAGKKGLEIVRKNVKRGIFQESEGAVIFPGEKYGLHSRVFINSQGLPTYEAKELGLAPTKYKDFKYDQSIIVTGNEIHEYFKVLIAALRQIYPELGEKTMHVSHGMVRLPQGKMSSRTGNVIAGEDLVDEVKAKARKLAGTSGTGFSEREEEEVAEKVALAAVKYSLLRVSLGKDIIFDFEKSLSLEGDSGPYLLYTYARCKSILRKAKFSIFNFQFSKKKANFFNEELDILRFAYRFPEVVQEAAEKYAPNLICNFVFELAQLYNNFYNTRPVLQAHTKEQRAFRLLLTAAVAQLIQNSLSLLGIKTLERM